MSKEYIIEFQHPFGRSPEDLKMLGMDWEAEQEWRKQAQNKFQKNMINFFSRLHKGKP